MAEKLFLIKVPEGAIVHLEKDATAVNMSPEDMAKAIAEAVPVEQIHTWSDICNADKVFAVRGGK